jgi:hypothetical protein
LDVGMCGCELMRIEHPNILTSSHPNILTSKHPLVPD